MMDTLVPKFTIQLHKYSSTHFTVIFCHRRGRGGCVLLLARRSTRLEHTFFLFFDFSLSLSPLSLSLSACSQRPGMSSQAHQEDSPVTKKARLTNKLVAGNNGSTAAAHEGPSLPPPARPIKRSSLYTRTGDEGACAPHQLGGHHHCYIFSLASRMR